MNIPKFACSLVLVSIAPFAIAKSFKPVEGGALYLKRLGYETHRAEFDNAEDCELIAKHMSEAEPQVEWYCSTSEEIVEYNCNLEDVLIKPWEGAPYKENFKMLLGLERGRTATLSHLSDFTYRISKPNIFFKTTDERPEGNYYSVAVTAMKLNTDTGQLIAFDIDGQRNGQGQCQVKVDK